MPGRLKMYTIDEIIDDLSFEKASKAACPDAAPGDVIFFDIETTGLSPSRSGLYLVGCMFSDGNNTILRQLFADDFGDEKEALEAFAELMQGKSHMVHFNGSTFDIPYLKTKYEQHGIKAPFDGKKSCDIYRKLMPLKRLLCLKSMKQKALEELSGVYREDVMTGGELIAVYKDYQKRVLLSRASGRSDECYEAAQLRKTLLLHNNEDIKGMLPVACLLGIVSFLSGEFDVDEPRSEDGGIRVFVEPRFEIPPCLFEGKSPLRIMTADDSGKLSVKVVLVNDRLRLFMKDYRDHYYIPSKDTAIHASLAGFIPSGEKKRATPATCYVTCEGRFLTINEDDLPEGLPLIKRDYGEKTAFVREEDISSDVLRAAVMYKLIGMISDNDEISREKRAKRRGWT